MGISPLLVAAIMREEVGATPSRALTQFNNPAGLMGGGPNNTLFQSFPSIEEGIAAAAENQAKNLYAPSGATPPAPGVGAYPANWLPALGNIYSPPGAANDPNHTNAAWPANVQKFMNQLNQTIVNQPGS
jgi:hypothetical protein